jgi:hypothetical protein
LGIFYLQQTGLRELLFQPLSINTIYGRGIFNPQRENMKTLILIVAYQAENHIQSVLSRIPWSRLQGHGKVLVLDDMQYVLASEFMRRSAENGYAKYSELANHYWQIINAAQSCRDDLVTIFISHNEVDNNGVSKIKTIGKLLDEKITIEGMFSTVLESRSTDDGYFFVTQNDGMSTCKSPFQMFDSKLIDNDLNFVIEKMNEYYNGETE